MTGSDTLSPDLIVLAAGLTLAAGYMIINQVILRLLVLTGTCLYIWYYAVAADEPLWTAIWTSIAMGCSTVIGLMLLWFRRSPASVPKAHRDIYHQFSLIPPGDFRAIMGFAQRQVLEEDLIVTREGRPVQTLYFVLKGEVSAEKHGHSFALPAGIFLGEVGCLTGQPASATTRIASGSEILTWDVGEVHRRGHRTPRLRLAMDAMISKDLALKVARAGSPPVERSADLAALGGGPAVEIQPAADRAD